MRYRFTIILAAVTVGCGASDKIATNAVAPDLNTMAEAPGDWSGLTQAVGRTPAESGLLQRSDISVDLNSLLGREVEAFRLALGDATPLTREGSLLVTLGRSGDAYLVIEPADHALVAGLKRDGRWQRFATPGANVPVPPTVQRLLAS